MSTNRSSRASRIYSRAPRQKPTGGISCSRSEFAPTSSSLLDALERLDHEPTRPEQIERFLAAISASLHTRGPSAGLGDDLRLRGEGVIGSGLQLDGELIQLSAFTGDGGPRLGRIARPSRRR
jgi:hypothetical protein